MKKTAFIGCGILQTTLTNGVNYMSSNKLTDFYTEKTIKMREWIKSKMKNKTSEYFLITEIESYSSLNQFRKHAHVVGYFSKKKGDQIVISKIKF